MWERFERSGWFAFVAGLVLGSGLTYLAGTELAAAYGRGLREVRWEVWAGMAPIWLAGGIAGWRAGRRRWPRQTTAQP